MLNCQMKYQMDPVPFMWFISTYLVPENNFFGGGGAIILENSIMRYELGVRPGHEWFWVHAQCTQFCPCEASE